MKKGFNLKENWARIAALALALLLTAGFFFCPTAVDQTSVTGSGRDKLEIPTDDPLTWTWVPQVGEPTELAIALSGIKKAAGMTVNATLTDEDGTEAASVRQPVDEMGDDKTIVLRGTFPAEKSYTLSLWAEGEGTIKVVGEEGENGEFQPNLRESGLTLKRNPVTLFFAAGLLLLALMPAASGTAGKRKQKASLSALSLLPLAAFLLVLAVGLLVCLQKPVYEPGSLWQSWDEEIHRDVVKDLTPLGAGSLSKWIGSLITWTPGYLPLILGESLAGLFTRDPEIHYRAAVLMSSLVYALMLALAIHHAPKYKISFLAAGTLPAIFFQMTCMTYDTVVTGTILLGLALVLESLEYKERLSPLRVITMTALLSFGTVAKPAYSLAVLMLWMLPFECFGGKKQAWIYRGFVLLLAVWCFAAVAIPGAYDNVKGGDERFAGTDSAGQIAYMLSSPLDGLLLPVRHLWENQDYLMNMGLSQWAYLGNSAELIELYLLLMLIVAPLCAWDEKNALQSPLSPGRRLGFAAIAFGAELILIYTQYIVSSPVGGSSVEGMQARYFIPLWIVLLMGIMAPRRLRDRISRPAGAVLSWAAFGLCAWANLSYALSWLSTSLQPPAGL